MDNDVKLLIITYEYKNQFAYASYPEIFRELNPNTWIVIHRDEYLKRGHKGFHNYILEIIEKNNINVVLYFEGLSFCLDLNFLERLREKVLLVLYSGDDCFYYDVHFKYLAQYFDMVLTLIIYAKYKYLEIGVDCEFVPPANDSRVYYPVENHAKDLDISFVGSIYQRVERKEFLDYLTDNEIKVEIWGPDTRFANDQQKIDIYRRSKINLDFTGLNPYTIFTIDHKYHRRKKHPKGRQTEIALTKSFLLSENAPGIDEYFTPETEIGIFNTKEELLEKVKYYLNNPTERERIANNAYNRAINNNEIRSQCWQILKLFKEKIEKRTISNYSQRKDYFIGKEYFKNYSTMKFYLFIKFLLNGKISFAKEELFLWFKKPRLRIIQIIYYLGLEYPCIKNIRKKFQKFVPNFK